MLAVLSTIASFLQVPGAWTLVSDWLDPVAEPLVHPPASFDWLTSVFAVIAGLAGLYVAYLIYEAHRRNVPRWPELQRTLEHKFWFDELYDALFYRPAELIAVWLRRDVETPYVEGSLVEIGCAARRRRGRGRIQSGLLRTYALAITVTVVVLAVVFVTVR